MQINYYTRLSQIGLEPFVILEKMILEKNITNVEWVFEYAAVEMVNKEGKLSK